MSESNSIIGRGLSEKARERRVKRWRNKRECDADAVVAFIRMEIDKIHSGIVMAKSKSILDHFVPKNGKTSRVYDDISRKVDDILFKAEAAGFRSPYPFTNKCGCGIELHFHRYAIHDNFVIWGPISHCVQWHRDEIPEEEMTKLCDCLVLMSNQTRERLYAHGANVIVDGESVVTDISLCHEGSDVNMHIVCGRCKETGVRTFGRKDHPMLYADFGKGEYGTKTRFEVDDGKSCNWCGRDY